DQKALERFTQPAAQEEYPRRQSVAREAELEVALGQLVGAGEAHFSTTQRSLQSSVRDSAQQNEHALRSVTASEGATQAERRQTKHTAHRERAPSERRVPG